MGVACRNAQLGTTEEEDDLEHTGHTYFSHCVRQPAHQTGAGAQALGTSRASSPRIYPVLLLQGADAETTSGPALGVMGGYRPLVWEDLTICFSQHGGWHESCQWQGTAFCLVFWLAFAQLLRLVRPQLLDPEGATDHPIIRGDSHRSPVRWKPSRSVQGLPLNRMLCLVGHLLEMSNIPDVI